MQQIGIFFGTETGTTRLVAKKIQARLGDALAAKKPLNVNRIEPAQLLAHDALILGTPSYGVGQIPATAPAAAGRTGRSFWPRCRLT
jgi:flavodoxin I